MFGFALLASCQPLPRRLVERVVVDATGVENHARVDRADRAAAELAGAAALDRLPVPS